MTALRLATLIDPLHVWPHAAGVAGRAGGAAAGVAGRAGGAAAEVAGRAVIRAIDRTAASPRTAEVVAVVVRSPLPARAVSDLVDVLLERGVVERVAERVLSGPEIDRLLVSLFDSPRMAELADRVAMRLLESDELWLIVDRIARSPAVTAAIARQGAGFVDQMADEVAERSRRADDRLERGARRLLRRRPTTIAAPPVTG